MLWNCSFNFAVEHWFGCHTTEPGFAGDIGAMEIWLIDWLIDWVCIEIMLGYVIYWPTVSNIVFDKIQFISLIFLGSSHTASHLRRLAWNQKTFHNHLWSVRFWKGVLSTMEQCVICELRVFNWFITVCNGNIWYTFDSFSDLSVLGFLVTS